MIQKPKKHEGWQNACPMLYREKMVAQTIFSNGMYSRKEIRNGLHQRNNPIWSKTSIFLIYGKGCSSIRQLQHKQN
jgi:hypothetical protein